MPGPDKPPHRTERAARLADALRRNLRKRKTAPDPSGDNDKTGSSKTKKGEPPRE